MTYVFLAREFTADDPILKLQRLQNSLFLATGNLDGCTPVPELYVAFKISCGYDYVTKLWRTPRELILYRVNPNLGGIGQGEARHKNHKRLKYCGGQAYDRLVD
jgi:hypothetical protein